tara:strand:+ start:775 stop:1017 length:243 start_codon:yes stop_codon:yes gene_type:complete
MKMDYLKINRDEDKESLFEYIIENNGFIGSKHKCMNIDELVDNVFKPKNFDIITVIFKDEFYLNELKLCLESEGIHYKVK